MYTNFPLYPTSIFSNTDYPAQADNTDTVYAALINALKIEIQACFDELGILPKGFHASVKDRISALELQLKIIIDSMEYASNAAAQAAYVSSDASSYSANILTGGTASAEQVDNGAAANAVDGDEDTHWGTNTAVYSLPTWWKYDLGSGITKIVNKISLKALYSTGLRIKDFTIQGSNNDSDWDTLGTYQTVNNTDWQYFYCSDNITAYRYYMVNITSYWEGVVVGICEIQMHEATPNLQCYSENIITKKDDYSLKVEALITGSLSDTLTRTVSPVKDLTGKMRIVLWARSDRTGENFKVEYQDSGGNKIEYTIETLVVDTWEEKIIDISAVDDADKDSIDQIKLTVLNADSTKILYIDDNYSA